MKEQKCVYQTSWKKIKDDFKQLITSNRMRPDMRSPKMFASIKGSIKKVDIIYGSNEALKSLSFKG